MQPSRYVARIAWDRRGRPTLPLLGDGILWGGHRAVSQTILSKVYARFSCLPGPARRGKVSRHFFTFADAVTSWISACAEAILILSLHNPHLINVLPVTSQRLRIQSLRRRCRHARQVEPIATVVDAQRFGLVYLNDRL